MRGVNPRHLRPDDVPIVLPDQGRVGAEFRITELGPRPVVLERRIHPVAEQLIEPLRGRGQALEVIVIEGTGHRPVDDLHVNIIEYDIDRIGLAAVGEFLTGEDDAVAGEIGLQRALRAVVLPVSNLGRNACKGILAEDVLYGIGIPS